jgi:hypothetical protein
VSRGAAASAEQAENYVQADNMGLAFRTMIDWMTAFGPIDPKDSVAAEWKASTHR